VAHVRLILARACRITVGASVCWLACSPIPEGDLTRTGSVSGTVFVINDSWGSGRPSGVQVELDGVTRAVTDENGAFRIDGVSVWVAHTLSVPGEAGHPESATIVHVAPGELMTQNLVVERPFSGTGSAKLGVIFVVDHGPGTEQLHERLVTGVHGLAQELLQGDLSPRVDSDSLNVAFITTDVVDPNPDEPPPHDSRYAPGCGSTAAGSVRGLEDFRHPRDAERFISWFTSCVEKFGTSGQGFPMPLTALKLALDQAHQWSPGFFQQNSALLVIVVTARDDCSILRSSDLLDEYAIKRYGMLNPMRCLKYSDQLEPIERYWRSLLVEQENNRVVVGIIAAPPVPVVSEIDQSGYAHLQPSCSDEGIAGLPAVRLAELAQPVPFRINRASVCSSDYGPALRAWARQALNLAAWVAQ
jgi:hypothetical protein